MRAPEVARRAATGLYRLRFVTHLDVDAAGVDRAIGRRARTPRR